MADQPHAPYPAPAPFYKSFTPTNLAQLRQLRKEQPTTSDSNVLALPPELRYLIPPEPPADGKWTSYGTSLSAAPTIPTLEENGIEQLYPLTEDAKSNPQPHLIALARSLLTTFLALVGVLSRDPMAFEGRVEDLQTILYNMHDLINQYRPHQARESLILMMEERIAKLRLEVSRIKEGREKVGELMAGLVEGGSQGVKKVRTGDSGANKVGSGGDGREQRQRGAWAALELEFSGAEAGA